MQFAAALVEYLISGILAATWAVPVFWRLFGMTPPMDDGWVVVYLPAAYVLGMFVDQTASELLVLLRLKKRAAPGGAYRRTTQILAKGSDAFAQTMQVTVSRDRIARGVFLNATISCLVLPWALPDRFKVGASCFAVVIVAWSLLMWKRLDGLSADFKQNAVSQLYPDTTSTVSDA